MREKRTLGNLIDLGDLVAAAIAFTLLFLVFGPTGLVIGALIAGGTLVQRLYR